jgi:multidrug transporter EmrE-like cation transporter
LWPGWLGCGIIGLANRFGFSKAVSKGDRALARSIDWILWGLLLVAVSLELIGDISLKWWAESNRWLGFGIGLVVYSLALVIFAVLLRRAELAVVFALWVGLAAVALTLTGWLIFGEALPPRRLAGVALVVGGMVLLGL